MIVVSEALPERDRDLDQKFSFSLRQKSTVNFSAGS